MNDVMLRQLLQSADAAAGSAPVRSRDLVAAIHDRLRQRRRIQFTTASLILCAIFVAVPLLKIIQKPTMPTVVRSDPAKIEAELALIRSNANAQSATIARLVHHQESLKLRDTARRFENGDPLGQLQQQRDRAARLLLHEASRSGQSAQYRRVIDLFPETPWATIARQRLGQSRI